MDRSVTILVLKKTKLGETDLIITGFSEDGSQVRAVAKGARRPGSKLGGSLELYSVTRVLMYEGKGLGIIREVARLDSNEACRADVIHSAGAAVIVELIEQISSEGNTEPRLFPLAREALRCLGDTPEDEVFLITAAAALKIGAQLGYRPSLQECVFCGSVVRLAEPAAYCHPEQAAQHRSIDFSFNEGGAICDDCSCSLGDIPRESLDTQLAYWIEILISSKFIDLEQFRGTSYSSLGKLLLRFTRNWICYHVVKRLKSLDFLLSFV